jgi:cytochrome c biogenesis DsbD-like protein
MLNRGSVWAPRISLPTIPSGFLRFPDTLRPLCLCVSLSRPNFQPSRRLVVSLLVLCLVLSAAAQSQVPSGREVVKPEIYASLDPAARGSSFQIAVVMKIRSGFHVNAREKSEDYLIATDLKSEVPAGFKSGEVAYPKGKLEKFAFSKIPLNVYQDTVTLFMPITALANAPLGEQRIPLKLRYQACSSEICLPPVTLTLDAAVNIAPSAPKPAHPEVFRIAGAQP